MRKILIVEDDKNIALLISDTLSISNHKCVTVYDGAEAFNLISENEFDLIILDIMLPGLNGFELQQKIKHLSIPIIFLTALQDIQDKVTGLRAGAEDYIVKPFDPLELLARVEVVLRRTNKGDTVLYYDDIVIDIDRHIVTKSGEVISLTHTEFEVLVYFVKNVDLAISRDRLLAAVWNTNYFGETRTVDTHVQNIRRKLNLHKKLITIPKLGYRLELKK